MSNAMHSADILSQRHLSICPSQFDTEQLNTAYYRTALAT